MFILVFSLVDELKLVNEREYIYIYNQLKSTVNNIHVEMYSTTSSVLEKKHLWISFYISKLFKILRNSNRRNTYSPRR